MVNSQSKFGTPSLKGDLVDVGKAKKLAQRVEETLSTMCLFADPKQLDPSWVLVASLNRLGAPPNKRHVHFWDPQELQGQKGSIGPGLLLASASSSPALKD